MSNAEFSGVLVISRKGHDKGTFYVIKSVTDDKHVFVVNGVNRHTSKPKRKNIRHLSITGCRVAAIDDQNIKKAIAEYRAKVNDGTLKVKK